MTEKMPRRRIRAHYKHLSEFERGLIIGLKECLATNPASNCNLTIIEDVSGDAQGSEPILLPLLHVTQTLNQELWPKVPFLLTARPLWSSLEAHLQSSDNLVALHFKYDQARRRFVEWAQNEIAVVPDFHKRILFSDEAHFWLNGYVNKQNCRIWSEANLQVYVETPLYPEKLTVWCALWAGGILLQKR
ncbi:hypothetical protein TNCV_4350891 [Trichonephila clavipes]|nr:hypothetical protein TNCV_4350891 [Trichonephila clavipes]